ncbi:MAG: O-antigen ligase family protein [Thermoflexales bacterium]|nr:O-antigen ligase family protein [Thermoflexales bacterium]
MSYLVFSSRHRWALALLGLLAAVLLGIAGGWLVATAGALLTAALVIGAVAGVWVLRDVEAAYLAILAIICLLPFGALPLPFSPKPTFLDLVVLALFVVWLARLATGKQRELIATPLGLPVVIFFGLAVATFVIGLGHASLDKSVARRFAELLASILLYFITVNAVRDVGRLQRLTRVFILLAAAAAVVAIVLYVLPDGTSYSLLLRLQRVGYYPEGGAILRYIRDDPSLSQRATGTSVDPNALGGLLMIALGVSAPQLFARARLFPAWLCAGLTGVMGLALVLTFSRASMGGVALALVILAALRYRRLGLILAVTAAAVLILPWTQAYVLHSFEGLQWHDLSSQMRLGEYKDAFILIQRYPLLGVGFVASPDIDTYLKVASVYLAIAARMGLVGLASFLAIAAVFFINAARAWGGGVISEELEPLWWGYQVAVTAALVGGILDHYFFNLDFHHAVTLFWVMLGLASASSRLVQDEMRERRPGGEGRDTAKAAEDDRRLPFRGII